MYKYNEFSEYYCSLPHIIELINKGVDVLDTFTTDEGIEYFVWGKTCQAYQAWIEEQTK